MADCTVVAKANEEALSKLNELTKCLTGLQVIVPELPPEVAKILLNILNVLFEVLELLLDASELVTLETSVTMANRGQLKSRPQHIEGKACIFCPDHLYEQTKWPNPAGEQDSQPACHRQFQALLALRRNQALQLIRDVRSEGKKILWHCKSSHKGLPRLMRVIPEHFRTVVFYHPCSDSVVCADGEVINDTSALCRHLPSNFNKKLHEILGLI